MKLSKEIENIIDWMVKYSDEFKGDREKAINHLITLGMNTYINQGLENYTPLDQEVIDSLNKSGMDSLKDYIKKS